MELGTMGDMMRSNGARLIKDIATLVQYTSGSSTYKHSSYPNNLTVFDNKLYFQR